LRLEKRERREGYLAVTVKFACSALASVGLMLGVGVGSAFI